MTSPLAAVALAVLVQTRGAARSDWKPYRSEKGSYSVLMPGTPTERKRPATVGGREVDLVTIARKKGPVAYSAAHADLEEATGDDPSALLDAARDAFLKDTKGTLAEERALDAEGRAGRELRVDVPRSVVAGGGVARARIWAYGARLYELSAVVPARQAKAAAREIDDFFASFRPIGPPPAPHVARRKAGARPRSEVVAKKESPARRPASTADASNGPPGRGDEAKVALRPGWQAFRSEEGRFSVAFPGRPEQDAKSGKFFYEELPMQGFRVERDGPRGAKQRFLVAFVDFPRMMFEGSDTEQTYARLLLGALAHMPGARLKGEQKLGLGQYTGREATIDLTPPAGSAGPELRVLRLFLVGGRLYQVIFEGSRGDAGSEDVAYFQDSFRLLGEAGAPKVLGPPDKPTLEPMIDYKSEAWGLAARLPGKPEESQPMRQLSGGPSPKVFMVMVQDGTFLYSITCQELPSPVAEGAIPGLLADAQKANVRGGKILSQRDLTVDGVRCREFTFESNQPGLRSASMARARAFATTRRVYVAEYLSLVPGAATGRADDFLESIRITP